MQRTALRRFHMPERRTLATCGACAAACLVVGLLALVDEPLASVAARVAGAAVVAWYACLATLRSLHGTLQADAPADAAGTPRNAAADTPEPPTQDVQNEQPPPMRLFSDLRGQIGPRKNKALRIRALGVLAVCAVAGIALSYALWLTNSRVLFAVLWVLAVALSALLFPLTLRALNINGLRLDAPLPLRLLHLAPVISLVPALFLPGGTAASLFFVPAATGLCLFPVVTFNIVCRVMEAKAARAPFGSVDGFLTLHFCTGALAFACSVALLCNLYDYPYTNVAGWAFSIVIAAVCSAAVCMCARSLTQGAAVAEVVEDKPVIIARTLDQSDDVGRGCQLLAKANGLTEREAEIMEYVACGKTRATIAKELWVTKDTVNTHVKHVYHKIGIHNRTELLDAVAKAVADAEK